MTLNQRIRASITALIENLERSDTSYGCCCCGEGMANHGDPMTCGHTPVDAGCYYAGKSVEEARAVLKAMDEADQDDML